MLPIERTRTGSTIPGESEGSPRPLRVALLTSHYWPEVRRGTERLVHDLAAGLKARHDSPVIIAGHGTTSSVTEEDGVEVARLRAGSGRIPSAFGYEERVGHLGGMRRRLRRERWDVVHSFGSYEAALASHATARSPATARIFTVTGIPRQANVEGLLWRRRALRRGLRDSDALVVLSQAARDALPWLEPDKRIIYPGVDLRAFRQSRDRASRPTLLCTAAAEDPRKRVPLVVEAFRQLRGRLPDARLVLSRRSGQHTVAGHGEPGVEHRDLDSHHALVDAYSEAWATVLISREEAFGLVAVESLACGTPVVASSDAGIAEAVGDPGAHARLFDGDRASDLAQELSGALDLAAEAGVREACRRRAERFSLDRFVEEYSALYEEMLARRAL